MHFNRPLHFILRQLVLPAEFKVIQIVSNLNSKHNKQEHTQL